MNKTFYSCLITVCIIMADFVNYMNAMSNQSPILNLVISSVKKSKSGGGIKNILCCIINLFPQILFLIILQHYIKNSDNLIEFLKDLIGFFWKKLLFKKIRIYPTCNKGKERLYLKNNYVSRITSVIEDKKEDRFPMSFVTVAHDGEGYFAHVFFWSKSFENINKKIMSKIDSEIAADNTVNCNLNQGNPDFCLSKGLISRLYPSRNYLKLTDRLDSFFELCKVTKNPKTKGILINGDPGLGKSAFCDFYNLNTKNCKKIIRLDMTLFIKHSFDIISDRFITRSNSEIVYVIDEFDKYVNFHIKNTYDEHREKYHKTILVSGATMELKSPKVFSNTIKTNILLKLLSLLDEKTEFPRIFLFCSNNFYTIFEGIDTLHFSALVTRFTNNTFERCDAEEFKNYCRFYNKEFENTRFYCPNLEELLTLVNDNKVTFRELDAIAFQSQMDFGEMINHFNEYDGTILVDLEPEEEEFQSEEKVAELQLKKDMSDSSNSSKEELKEDVPDISNSSKEELEETGESDGKDGQEEYDVYSNIEDLYKIKPDTTDDIEMGSCFLKNRAVEVIKAALAKLDNMRERNKRVVIVYKIMEFLNKESTKESLIKYGKFSNTVNKKIQELSEELIELTPLDPKLGVTKEQVQKLCLDLDFYYKKN